MGFLFFNIYFSLVQWPSSFKGFLEPFVLNLNDFLVLVVNCILFTFFYVKNKVFLSKEKLNKKLEKKSRFLSWPFLHFFKHVYSLHWWKEQVFALSFSFYSHLLSIKCVNFCFSFKVTYDINASKERVIKFKTLNIQGRLFLSESWDRFMFCSRK